MPKISCVITPDIRDCRTGLDVLKLLTRNEKLFNNVHEIPQGCSSAFAAQLVKELDSIENGDSLLDNLDILDRYPEERQVKYCASFIGQRGNLQRNRFLETFRQNSESRFLNICKNNLVVMIC